VRVTPRTGQPELDSLHALARTVDRVVVYTYTRTLEGAGRFAIAPRVAAFVDSLASSGVRTWSSPVATRMCCDSFRRCRHIS
jgi:hypothetical protein